MNGCYSLIIALEPIIQVLTEIKNHIEWRRLMIVEGVADLQVKLIRRILPISLGTQVVYLIVICIFVIQELLAIFHWISDDRFHLFGGETHRNNIIRYIGEIEVEVLRYVPLLLLRVEFFDEVESPSLLFLLLADIIINFWTSLLQLVLELDVFRPLVEVVDEDNLVVRGVYVFLRAIRFTEQLFGVGKILFEINFHYK